jgi:glycosyltransferase involved in cell wall biosynthesis
MKILYIITKSEIGGAQTHVLQLLKHMKNNGYTVALMCAPDGWLVQEAKKIGVVVYPNTYFKNTYNPIPLFRAYHLIKKVLAVFNPSLVHCHSSFAGFLGRIAVRNNIPTIFTAHSWAFTDGAGTARKMIASVVERFVAVFTHKIICVSHYDQELAVKYRIAPKEKLITIHNGTPIGTIVNRESTTTVRLISVGRLAYPKEFTLLIRAFDLLSDEIRKRAHLTIVGDGPLREALEKEIQQHTLTDYITLMGAKNPDQIQGVLHSSDIFVLLSKHEGFPMTILEAMEAGLPVIASHVGGIPEQVDSSSGMLVQNNIEAIAQALNTLISDESKRIGMGVGARRRAEIEFSEEQFLQKTEAVYKEVLAK